MSSGMHLRQLPDGLNSVAKGVVNEIKRRSPDLGSQAGEPQDTLGRPTSQKLHSALGADGEGNGGPEGPEEGRQRQVE